MTDHPADLAAAEVLVELLRDHTGLGVITISLGQITVSIVDAMGTPAQRIADVRAWASVLGTDVRTYDRGGYISVQTEGARDGVGVRVYAHVSTRPVHHSLSVEAVHELVAS